MHHGLIAFSEEDVILRQSVIKNVYNAGSLKVGKYLYGIGPIGNTDSKIDFENAYYIDTAEKGSNLFNEKLNRVNEATLKSQATLNNLNKYVEENKIVKVNDEISVELKKWEIKGENQYPTLK